MMQSILRPKGSSMKTLLTSWNIWPPHSTIYSTSFGRGTPKTTMPLTILGRLANVVGRISHDFSPRRSHDSLLPAALTATAAYGGARVGASDGVRWLPSHS